MNITGIDLNLLVYFDVLMKERNVSQAALQLKISQPALSNALSRLRKQLGDPLLIRTSRGMTPTEKALELHEPIQQAIQQLRDTLMLSKPFDPLNSKQQFTIACMDAVNYPLMACVIGRLQQEAPDITLNLIPPTECENELLEHGMVDLLIQVFDEGIGDSFHKRKLMNGELACVCRMDHPLFDEFGELSLDAYLAYPHLRITLTGVGAGHSNVALQKQGQQRHVQVQSKQSALIPILMVLESDLIATVPLATAKSMAAYLPITIIPTPIALDKYVVEMAWGPVMHHNRGHQWLRNLIVEVAIDVSDK
jgi:DNA-binding transcriptional LysR family regulator